MYFGISSVNIYADIIIISPPDKEISFTGSHHSIFISLRSDSGQCHGQKEMGTGLGGEGGGRREEDGEGRKAEGENKQQLVDEEPIVLKSPSPIFSMMGKLNK